MKKLTDSTIRAALAKPRTDRVDMVDGTVSGLCLRLGRTRGATWSLLFRVTGAGGVTNRGYALKGEKHRVSLGEYPAVTLEAARSKANEYLDQAKRGECPIDGLEKAATAHGLTIAGLAEKFLAEYVRSKELRALPKYQCAIDVHIVIG